MFTNDPTIGGEQYACSSRRRSATFTASGTCSRALCSRGCVQWRALSASTSARSISAGASPSISPTRPSITNTHFIGRDYYLYTSTSIFNPSPCPLEKLSNYAASVLFSAIELCLTELARCDLFLGFLGERYGWQPPLEALAVARRSPALEWAHEYAERYAGAHSGRLPSITELECAYALHVGLGPHAAPGDPAHTDKEQFRGRRADKDASSALADRRRRAFFYLRSPEFIAYVLVSS